EGQSGFDRRRVEYPETLARHGLDVLGGNPVELVEKIRAFAVRESIIAALDDLALQETDSTTRQRLLKLANSADEADPWRQAVRRALAQGQEKKLRQLAGQMAQGKPTSGVVLLLAFGLRRKVAEAIAPLRRMQLERPGEFWINFALGG